MRPDVSVVVPTFDRPRRLALCLQALAAQDYPRDGFEVVVVNDGGSPPEEAVAAARGRLALTLVHQENAGPAAARNRGAELARGRILAFTDDDCAPAPDWLRLLGDRVAADPECLVGGRTVNAMRDVPCAEASQLLVDYLYAHYGGGARDGGNDGPRFFTSNNFALARDRFMELGGFDASFPRAAGEDRDFCDRWSLRGWRMRLVPEAVVHHSHDMGLRGYWRQHFAYGAAAYHFHRLRAQRAASPVRVEPPSFYGRLVLYPFSRRPPLRASMLSTLLLLSQVANTAGYAAARWGGE